MGKTPYPLCFKSNASILNGTLFSPYLPYSLLVINTPILPHRLNSSLWGILFCRGSATVYRTDPQLQQNAPQTLGVLGELENRAKCAPLGPQRRSQISHCDGKQLSPNPDHSRAVSRCSSGKDP